MSDKCLTNAFQARLMSVSEVPGYRGDERSECYRQAGRCFKLHEQAACEFGNATATAQDGTATTDNGSVATGLQAQPYIPAKRKFESPADRQREFCFRGKVVICR